MYQTTIKKRIHCAGVGLHSGKMVELTMRPAAENTGIVFHIVGPEGVRDISPTPGAVISTGLATTLGAKGVAVSTVEHLLAALRGLSIDNIHIDVDGAEIPIMDGSAAPFVLLFKDAGIHVQSAPRKVLRVREPFTYEKDGKSIVAEPYDGFAVDCLIDFPHPAVGRQRLTLNVTPQSFAQVAMARTFGFLRDVEALQSRGLALGGSLSNAVVLDERGVVNEEGLRAPDEFVRHKLLDFIGDMAMLPLPLMGRFTVRCSGHAVNNEFLRAIVAGNGLQEVTLAPSAAPRRPKVAQTRPEARPEACPALAG